MSFIRKLFTSQSFYLWLVCIALISYALLRAWFVAPLHDENATFYHFIETGAIWGKGALLDANNHLLNSYIGRFFYTHFGEHYFLFRLPSALSIGIYFWAIWKLTVTFPINWQRWLVTLAIVCIPFVLDYFSYTRGYGLAICFFSCALYFLQRWLFESKGWLLFVLIGCLLLSVSANLTFLVSAILLMSYVLFYSLMRFKSLNRWQLLSVLIVILLFVLGIKPLLGFSFELKDVGALYYGSLDGFWIVTGKTLCKYVLFYDVNWLKWAVCCVALICGVLVLQLIKRHKWNTFLQRPESWGTYLIVGNVLSILYLAKVMLVNYPEDRAAMYFIPLVLLVFGAVVGQFKRLQFFLLILLFFPIHFLLQLNLSTSVFTPDQRMSFAFYHKVRQQLKQNDRLCVDPIQQLNWAHFEREYQKKPHFAVAQRTHEGGYDVLITNTIFPTDSEFKKNYTQLAIDSDNGMVAYQKRIKNASASRHLIVASNYVGTDEFIPLWTDSTITNWVDKRNSYLFSGEIKIDTCYRDLQLVVTTEDSTGQTVLLDSFNFRWYLGENKQVFRFEFPYTRRPLSEQETKLKVYIWNPERHLVKMKNGLIRVIFDK